MNSLTQAEIDRLGDKAKFEIFSRCKSHLDDADMMISPCSMAVGWMMGLHGRSGIFTPGKSPEQKIIGIRTDFRRAGGSEGAIVNVLIEGACDLVVRSREEVLGAVSRLL
jgi:hypothetical protein